jgi:hypothetical protein
MPQRARLPEPAARTPSAANFDQDRPHPSVGWSISAMKYRAPWWLPGGNLQTIWPALYARRVTGGPPQYQRERWDTPDGDFIDVDFLDPPGAQASPVGDKQPQVRPEPERRPLLVLFHGLEGSSRSHYAEAFAGWASRARDWVYAVPHFRGCSGETQPCAPRAYHCWRLRGRSAGCWRRLQGPASTARKAAGRCSCRRRVAGRQRAAALGWRDGRVGQRSKVAAMRWPPSAPRMDHDGRRPCHRARLQPAGLHPHVPATPSRPRRCAKQAQHPGLFDRGAPRLAVRDLHAFDQLFTAPLHGFRQRRRLLARAPRPSRTWRASACRRWCSMPATIPSCPPAVAAPDRAKSAPAVTLWQPAAGRPRRFSPKGAPPGHLF